MNIYTRLEKNSDFLNFKLEKSSSVKESIISENEIIIKNLENNKFLALNKQEYFIWGKLQGDIKIKDVIVLFFLKYGEYSRNYVLKIIYEFYINGFLKKKPRNIFNELKEIERKKSFKHKIKQFSSFFFNFKIEIKNLDSLLSCLFDKFIFIFYKKIFFLTYFIISIVGVILFAQMAISGKYSIWEVKNSATIGTLIAIIINLMLTSIHEAAHAFTTKYYKQKVDRGGILLYFGLPCFYVDTNEIWLVGKKARLIVSWAGPWSTIIVSSVATLFLNVFPDFHQSQIIFKIAFWGIIGAIINLNPLLELDGYYMLIDYLKKPMLRVKSILYVRETFKNLVFKKQVSKLEWDKIIYACLAAFWSFLSVVLVVVLIEYRSKIIIKDFIEQNSMIIKILGATVMAFWMLPVIVSIILFVFLKIKELTIAILKTKIFMVPKYLTILLCVPIIVLFFHKDSIVGNLTVACLLALYFIYRYRFLNRSKLFSAIKLNFLFFTVLVVNKYFINPNEFLIVFYLISCTCENSF